MGKPGIRRGCTKDVVAQRLRHERFAVQPRMHRGTAVEPSWRAHGAFTECTTKLMRHDGAAPGATTVASRSLCGAVVPPQIWQMMTDSELLVRMSSKQHGWFSFGMLEVVGFGGCCFVFTRSSTVYHVHQRSPTNFIPYPLVATKRHKG